MAKKSDKNQGKKGSGKKQELSFAGKIKRFFGSLKNELKLVVWPDKKEVKQTTAVVLVVVAATVILVFVVDSIMVGILRLTGFDTAPASGALNPGTVQTEKKDTEEKDETAETTVVEVTAPAETTAGE